MDHVSKVFFCDRFQIAFLNKRGNEFQDWFTMLAKSAYGSDFEKVSNYGNQGDWKCDGRLVSTGTIFQCYAPKDLRVPETKRKIKKDFFGVLDKWPDFMECWVFVHNHRGGLPAQVIQYLDQIRKEHPSIKVKTWSYEDLYNLHKEMSEEDAVLMYGPVPTNEDLRDLSLQDLQPVIDALETSDINLMDSSLLSPSAEKLEKNNLSDEVADLLRLGRRKSHLVESYFKTIGPVERGEHVAEAFRKRYKSLRALGMSPDHIFRQLQELAGFGGSPKRQIAAMAVIIYFFDKCDIFEDPE